MNLNRKNTVHKIDNLPELTFPGAKYNGEIIYTGSIIKRPIRQSLNVYKHYGVVYGHDADNTLWIIENNFNGVECVTFADFMAENERFEIRPLTNKNRIPLVLKRIQERAVLDYDERYNNCEHFARYVSNGQLESKQVQVTEALVNLVISYQEIMISLSQEPETKILLNRINEFRKTISLKRPESVERLIQSANEKVKIKRKPRNQKVNRKAKELL